MKPIIILLFTAAIFAGGYDPDHIDTDSCKTVLYNNNYNIGCLQPLQERLTDAARINGLTIKEYIEQAIIERLEYDEEEYFFKTGKILK